MDSGSNFRHVHSTEEITPFVVLAVMQKNCFERRTIQTDQMSARVLKTEDEASFGIFMELVWFSLSRLTLKDRASWRASQLFSRSTASRPKKYREPVEAGLVPTTSARRMNLPSFGAWTPRLIGAEGVGFSA